MSAELSQIERIVWAHREICSPADIAFKAGLLVGILTYVAIKRRVR